MESSVIPKLIDDSLEVSYTGLEIVFDQAWIHEREDKAKADRKEYNNDTEFNQGESRFFIQDPSSWYPY